MYPEVPLELLLVDEAGRTEPLPGFDKTLAAAQMRYSPDGRQLAFTEQFQSGLLWLFDVERQTYRVLSEEGVAGSPIWSPDGRRLAVAWSEVGPQHLWIVPVDGGDWERLTAVEQVDWPESWSPDGRFLAFLRAGGEGGNDVFLYRFEDGLAVPYLNTAAAEHVPEFSPDGRWLAYVSMESGRGEVYVTSFPDRERTLTVSRAGGWEPAWSRDGRTLFYLSPRSPEDGRRTMMAVPVELGPDLSLGSPRALFRLPDGTVSLGSIRSYDLHPDGRRFVIARWLEREPEPPITRLTLVQNWFAELERLSSTP
jgi:Tol biopolymer transport system component